MTDKITISSDLANILYENAYGTFPHTPDDAEGWTILDVQEGDSRRWFKSMSIIIKNSDDLTYALTYDQGLTENQDNWLPWRNDIWGNGSPTIDVTRVYPHTITTIYYTTVNPDAPLNPDTP